MKAESENSQLITKLFFRLLPIQIFLAAVSAVNGIVSSLFASNFIGTEAMSAIGLYVPVDMLITALSLMIIRCRDPARVSGCEGYPVSEYAGTECPDHSNLNRSSGYVQK